MGCDGAHVLLHDEVLHLTIIEVKVQLKDVDHQEYQRSSRYIAQLKKYARIDTYTID